MKRIGASVASHRLQANISQQALAERCGVSLLVGARYGIGTAPGVLAQVKSAVARQ